jgi:hypothetical protein
MPTEAPSRHRPTLATAWGVAAVAAPTIRILASRMPTVDFAYHVRAGTEILDRGSLPGGDTWTFGSEGVRWLDQQWGAQVLLSLVHRAGGWPSVVALGGALVTATLLLVYLACREAGAGPRAAALLTFSAYLVGATNLPTRPQLFGILLFATSQLLIERRRRRPVGLLLVPVLVAAWANLHGSFPLGLALLGLASVEDLSARRDAGRTLLATGLAAAATFASPYGWRVWAYAADVSTNPTVRAAITEWNPPTVRTATGLAFIASVVAVGMVLARQRHPVGWLPLLRLGLFFALALPAMRGTVWWALVAPVVVAGLLGREGPGEAGSPVLNRAIVAGLVVGVVVALPWWRAGSDAAGSPRVLSGAPAGLVSALEARVPPGTRVFASQEFASWLELEAPAHPLFVDSRIELFPARAWRDYFAVTGAREGWGEILVRHGVGAVVASRSQSPALLEAIGDDPAWELVYEDGGGAVFVRIGISGGAAP